MSLHAPRQRAFTLIELLIVITIIGILAVALLPQLTGGQGRARDAKRKADLQQISTALEFYYSDHGSYPGSNACVSALTTQLGSSFTTGIPADPQNLSSTLGSTAACSTGGYSYYALNGGASGAAGYILSARLENTSDAGPDVYDSSFSVGSTSTAAANFSNTANVARLCSTTTCTAPTLVIGR